MSTDPKSTASDAAAATSGAARGCPISVIIPTMNRGAQAASNC
jgi:hypothetical protein